MSTVKKLFLFLIILGGGILLLLLFLWNNYLSERYRDQYMDGKSVTDIAFDNAGQAWISACETTIDYSTSPANVTYKGDIGVFTEGEFTSRAGNLDLSDKCVSNLVVDQQGRPWGTISSSSFGGLVVYDDEQWILHARSQNGLSEDQIAYADLAIGPDGKVWLGLLNGGVNVFDGQKWTLFGTSNSALTNDNVADIIFDQQGRAWIGTGGGGINIFDGKTWSSMTSSNSSLPWDVIHSLTFDQDDRLWVGTNLGLYVQGGENWTQHTVYDLINSSGVNTVVFDGRGRAWVADAFQRGAHPLIIDGDKWTLYRADFSGAYYTGNMVSDKDGKIWLGSSNKRGFTVISPEYDPPGNFISTLKVFLSTGGISFLALLLLGVCLTIVFDSYLGTAVGMGIGLLILGAAFVFGQGTLLEQPVSIYLVPGAAITILGAAGGILGKVVGRSRPVRGQLIGALLGLIPTIIITICILLATFVIYSGA